MFLKAYDSLRIENMSVDRSENQKQEESRRALLAGVCTGKEHDFQVGMDELEALALSCDLVPVRRVTQHLPWTDKATCAGPGKVEEIRALADAEEADLVIFNNSLTPAQISNLTKLLEVEVLDRTALILQIFSRHAFSREARIQVEYAKLQYILPRLVGMRRNLSRQGGGSGALSNKGSGEMQIELDRRHIERRMSVLRRELKKISLSRETQRSMRRKNHLPLVSMVGYTNAGKSTLMNALIDWCTEDTAASSATKDAAAFDEGNRPEEVKERTSEKNRHVFVKDMVFATLDTSVRRIDPHGAQAFLLSDTVGFINDLPTALVEAFHSTLEEVLEADLILEVVDVSDPEHAMQMEVTDRTLSELGAAGIPRIRVMNKVDLTREALPGTIQEQSERIFLSAAGGDGVENLVRLIEEKLNGETIQVSVLIPYGAMSALEALHTDARILNQEYMPEGVKLKARMDMDMLRRYKDYVI